MFHSYGIIQMLLQLIDFEPHPFIHAGAIMISEFVKPKYILSSFRALSKNLSMKGYNSIDFKIVSNEIFIFDINPRITSTFKIYNDQYENNLLNLMIHPNLKKIEKNNNNNMYAFIHMFVKQKYRFNNKFSNDPSFINLPAEGQCVEKNQPLLSIYVNSLSKSDLMMQLKEKISITRNLYNCYDIDI